MTALELVKEGKSIIVLHNGKHLGELKKNNLNEKEYKKYLKSKQTKEEDEITKTAKYLAGAYARAKKKHFGSRDIKKIKEGTADFRKLKEAAEICLRHKVKTKKFIESQIQGLKFLKNGHGAFPKPSHLCTEQAETRLLDYLEDEKFKNSDIPITSYEKETSLKYNKKYNELLEKIKDCEATIYEANYVASCQKLRRKKVSMEVQAYIKVLKEEMNVK